MKRTAAIYILAIIAVLAGLVAVVDTLRYMQWLFSPLSFIWFWAAARIWNVDPRGWIFMVTIAGLYLILDVISLIAGTPIELLLPSIFMSGLALIIGLLPSTKAEFGTG